MNKEYRNCPHCSEWILRDAVICRFCGNGVEAIANYNDIEKIRAHEKRPWLAGLLNAFPLLFGLGYAYLGKWLRFFVVVLIQLFSLAPFTALGLREYNKYFLAMVWVGSVVDAYNLAKGD